MKRFFILFVCSLLLVNCSGGGGGGSDEKTITPLNKNDISTLHGTYEVTRVEFIVDGFSSSTNDVDFFEGYMAFDTENKTQLVDLYAVDNGKIILNDSFIMTETGVAAGQGSTNLDVEILYEYIMISYVYDVYVNGEYVNYIYNLKKISDEIEEEYFDILT